MSHTRDAAKIVTVPTPPHATRAVGGRRSRPAKTPHSPRLSHVAERHRGGRETAAAEAELLRAMQDYSNISGRMFPTWSEVLEVLKGLGYEKPVA